MTKTNATIADVARLAGVSTATAGRVLGQYGYSSAEKRARVMAAAEELDYRPNVLARGLMTGSTGTIGVIAADIQTEFYAQVLRGVSDVLAQAGFGVLITNSDERLDSEVQSVNLLREKQVDGLIVSPCDIVSAAHLRDAAASGLPMVFVDRCVGGMEVPCVRVENVSSTRTAIARILRAGHTRVALIGELESSAWPTLESFVTDALQDKVSIPELYPSWQRFLGYILAYRDAGLEIDLSLVRRTSSYSVQSAERQAEFVLSAENRPTALFTTDGLMSVGAMRAVFNLGLRVPDDLSLCCFDDLDWMAFLNPGIDAISQPRRAMGEAAAEMLIGLINGTRSLPARQELAPRLIIRGSLRTGLS